MIETSVYKKQMELDRKAKGGRNEDMNASKWKENCILLYCITVVSHCQMKPCILIQYEAKQCGSSLPVVQAL
jgi:hypothetical protein